MRGRKRGDWEGVGIREREGQTQCLHSICSTHSPFVVRKKKRKKEIVTYLAIKASILPKSPMTSLTKRSTSAYSLTLTL